MITDQTRGYLRRKRPEKSLLHSTARYALLLVLALGCSLSTAAPEATPTLATQPPPPVPPPQPTTLPGPPGAPPSLEGEALSLELPEPPAFAPYDPPQGTPAQAEPPLGTSLSLAGNFTAVAAHLPTQMRNTLSRTGAVVVPEPYDTFAQLYSADAVASFPPFVSSDTALYALDLLADVAWQRAVRDRLAPELLAITQEMVEASLAQWEAAADPFTADAALRNLGFFSVAGRLLDKGFAVPAPVRDLVADELTLIEQGGEFVSPLSGQAANYTLFAPPSAAGGAARYSQAMAWYTQPLYLQASDVNVLRRSGLRALLQAQALQDSEQEDRWRLLFETAVYFQGQGSGLHMGYAIAAAAAIVEQDGALDDFILTLQALPPQAAEPPGQDQQAAQLPHIRFLPLPSAPHTAATHALVFNRVGDYLGDTAGSEPPLTLLNSPIGPIRGLARPLDVPAALGSELALSHLQEAGDAAYAGYDDQLAGLQREFASRDAIAWTQTLGGAWLYSTQPLLDAGTSQPLTSWFGGWVLNQTQTQLAPYEPPANGAPDHAVAGYVEARPLLYARLAALAHQLRDGLDSRGLLGKELGEKLRYLEGVLQTLRVISEKELTGAPLTAIETEFIASYPTRLQFLLTYSGDEGIPQTGATTAQLFNLYENVTLGQTTQAAVGEVWPVYLLLAGDQRPIVVAGGVFSAYELRRADADRFDLATWQTVPNRPPSAGW